MQFLAEAYADKIHANLAALSYTGATLDMLEAYLLEAGYTGSLPDMYYNYLSDNSLLGLTHDELIAELDAGTMFPEIV